MESTKHEIRSTKQIQNSNDKNSKRFGFEILNLDIVSDFDIRISDFLKRLFRISIFEFHAFSFLLDLLFPRKAAIRELERMDPSEFSAKAGKARERAGKDILSCLDYKDPLVRQAIWELKYRGNKKVVKLLGAILADELLAFLEEYGPLTNFIDPLLIPVPLSKKREAERGFNQCRLLVDEIMRLDAASSFPSSVEEGWPKAGVVVPSAKRGSGNFTLCPTALTKIKDTQSQTKADSRKKRLQNLEGCFAADPSEVEGRNIILIDDVATTGATLDEARRTLRAAGAKKVICFTVAH